MPPWSFPTSAEGRAGVETGKHAGLLERETPKKDIDIGELDGVNDGEEHMSSRGEVASATV